MVEDSNTVSKGSGDQMIDSQDVVGPVIAAILPTDHRERETTRLALTRERRTGSIEGAWRYPIKEEEIVVLRHSSDKCSPFVTDRTNQIDAIGHGSKSLCAMLK